MIYIMNHWMIPVIVAITVPLATIGVAIVAFLIAELASVVSDIL